ncbi:MAG: glycosyltransferase family 9 protein, partial [Nitrosopumilus sp.]|nr:glycosyltransferase family 9 protein [Nitrosopumilus sp.]
IENSEIHFLTKENFKSVIEFNPYIDKRIYFRNRISDIIKQLRQEKYDLIIDLHKSLRSKIITSALRTKTISFDKLNYEKWLLVRFKKNKLPSKHIVDRYFEAFSSINIINDNKGLDFYTGDILAPVVPFKNYIAFVIGAKHETKKLPAEKIINIIKLLEENVILTGGDEDIELGEIIRKALPEKVFNACGRYSLIQSALVVKNADGVITHDTGLMHIAAAYKKNIISVWGNTVPEFGMYPYMPDKENKSVIAEVKNLYCRPCSKIGYPRCPEKHFRCMYEQDEKLIAEAANKFL